jgi:hypothetical protein
MQVEIHACNAYGKWDVFTLEVGIPGGAGGRDRRGGGGTLELPLPSDTLERELLLCQSRKKETQSSEGEASEKGRLTLTVVASHLLPQLKEPHSASGC